MRSLYAAVFVEEQGIPAELEWDANDVNCLHAVAYSAAGEPVERVVFCRMGMSDAWLFCPVRGHGVGAEILRNLMAQAKSRGDGIVMLNAQQSAEPFYRKRALSVSERFLKRRAYRM
jgi:predicted GNAT family N-acyltransferase